MCCTDVHALRGGPLLRSLAITLWFSPLAAAPGPDASVRTPSTPVVPLLRRGVHSGLKTVQPPDVPLFRWESSQPPKSSVPAAAPSPVGSASLPPSSQPAAAAETPPPTKRRPALADERRKGFHVGPGISIGYFLVGFGSSLEAHFDYSFGLLSLRLTPKLLGLLKASQWLALGASVHSQAHLNLGRVFAITAGFELGALPTPQAGLLAAPSFGAALKFGKRSELNLGLTFLFPLTGQPFGANFSFGYLF